MLLLRRVRDLLTFPRFRIGLPGLVLVSLKRGFKESDVIVTVRLPCRYHFYFCSARREEAGSHRARYAARQEQRAGAGSLLPAAPSGSTPQNGETQGKQCQDTGQQSEQQPQQTSTSLPAIAEANKSLTGSQRGTTWRHCWCSLGKKKK